MNLNIRSFDIPLREPFRIATGQLSQLQGVACAVDHDGIVGLGEAAPFEPITGGTQASTVDALKRLPNELDDVKGGRPAALLDAFGGGDLPPDARNAVDTALHDWAARRAGISLARLLGGRPRSFDTSVTVPIVPVRDVPRIVNRGIEQGFRVFKIKSHGGNIDEEIQRVNVVRDLAGSQAELRVDANAGWSLDEAKRMLPALARADVAFLEQPLGREDLDGHAELTKDAPIPIMVDECVFTLEDAKRVVKAKAAHIINVKLAKSGGPGEAARILRYAGEHGIDCMVGCMVETRIAISAAAHVASAFPAVRYVDLDGHTFLARDPVQGGARIRDGVVEIPDTPGHGATMPLGHEELAAV